jgi:hypothetical protein
MSAKVKLVVYQEHTLGYITPELPNYVQILHSSVLRGSPKKSDNFGSFMADGSVRLATEKDFDDYRCYFSDRYRTDEFEYQK